MKVLFSLELAYFSKYVYKHTDPPFQTIVDYYSLIITQEFPFHTFPLHILLIVLTTWMPFCFFTAYPDVSSPSMAEWYPSTELKGFLISPIGGIFSPLWSTVAFHSCIKKTANYLQSNRVKGGMVNSKINYMLLYELKELQMWDDNINGNFN